MARGAIHSDLRRELKHKRLEALLAVEIAVFTPALRCIAAEDSPHRVSDNEQSRAEARRGFEEAVDGPAVIARPEDAEPCCKAR